MVSVDGLRNPVTVGAVTVGIIAIASIDPIRNISPNPAPRSIRPRQSEAVNRRQVLCKTNGG